MGIDGGSFFDSKGWPLKGVVEKTIEGGHSQLTASVNLRLSSPSLSFLWLELACLFLSF